MTIVRKPENAHLFRLQCSRGDLAAVTWRRPFPTRRTIFASMQPRRSRRGDADVDEARRCRLLASMQPRRSRRGDPTMQTTAQATYTLQCSRGDLAAVTMAGGATEAAKVALQCSRGDLAAVTGAGRRPLRSVRALQCSRGDLAAVTECVGGGREPREWLQCSRGDLAAVTLLGLFTSHKKERASMQPRRSRRGDAPSSSQYRLR